MKVFVVFCVVLLGSSVIAQEATPPPITTTTLPPPPPPPKISFLCSSVDYFPQINQHISRIQPLLNQYCSTNSDPSCYNWLQEEGNINGLLNKIQQNFGRLRELLKQHGMDYHCQRNPVFPVSCEEYLQQQKQLIFNLLNNIERNLSQLKLSLRQYFSQQNCQSNNGNDKKCADQLQQQQKIFRNLNNFQQEFREFRVLLIRHFAEPHCLSDVPTTSTGLATQCIDEMFKVDANGTITVVKNATQLDCDFTQSSCQTYIQLDANGCTQVTRQCKQAKACEINSLYNAEKCYPGVNNIRQCWFCCTTHLCNNFDEIPPES